MGVVYCVLGDSEAEVRAAIEAERVRRPIVLVGSLMQSMGRQRFLQRYEDAPADEPENS